MWENTAQKYRYLEYRLSVNIIWHIPKRPISIIVGVLGILLQIVFEPTSISANDFNMEIRGDKKKVMSFVAEDQIWYAEANCLTRIF